MLNLFKLFQTPWLQISLITLVGGIIRFWGILHGFQENYLYHPDSELSLGGVWNYYLGISLAEKSHAGQVYNFIMVFALGASESLLRFLGIQFNWSVELIGVAASLVSGLLGTATIPFLFILGKRAYNTKTGLWASAFLSVCPLHSFHSHYPYRDIPMIFFLVISLCLCVAILRRPSLSNLGLGTLAALLTAAMKPAGVTIFTSFLAASIISLLRLKKYWILISFSILLTGISFWVLSFRFGINFFTYIISQFFQTDIKFITASTEIFDTFKHWIGLPSLLAILIGVVYSLYCFRSTDTIFLVFLISAFFVLINAYYIDERFMIFLLPCGFVMLARLITDVEKKLSQIKYLTIIPFLVASSLLLNAFTQSVWQGILFSLHDTRYLSGIWVSAHLPKNTKIATEGYYPLAVKQWPTVFSFNPSQPVYDQSNNSDIIITSSLDHQRYFDFPYRFPKLKLFYEQLNTQGFLLKKVSLDPVGFIHPTIKVFSSEAILNRSLIKNFNSHQNFIPRPYDTSWNGGISFLEQGFLDRDDRTIRLGWGHRYTSTLVSPKTGQEMVVFILNGEEKSIVKVRVGYKTKIRSLKPNEFHILPFRPRWLLPKMPALYHFEAGLPEGKEILIQLRCGNREIGEAFSKWGDHQKAVSYLQKALAENPNDLESGCLLSVTYQKLGKLAEARQAFQMIQKQNPDVLKYIKSLGESDISYTQWEKDFQNYTGLKPSLLRYALSQEFQMDKVFPSPSGAGEMKDDCRASGGKVIVYDRALHKPAEVMHGPYLHLDQGAYLAGFFLRTWDVRGDDPIAEIKVLADNQVISSEVISAKNFKEKDKLFKEVQIPFFNPSARAEIKFQVFATGSASFAVEKVRLEPDLRKAFQIKWLNLKSIAGEEWMTKEMSKVNR